MDNRTISAHGNDKACKKKKTISLPLYRLYAIFRLLFIPEENEHHNRADFVNRKKGPGKSTAETWNQIGEIVENCGFEQTTAAERLASKLLSVVGKTTVDNDLKKKMNKGDMSMEAITNTIYEYMYEKNESRVSKKKQK